MQLHVHWIRQQKKKVEAGSGQSGDARASRDLSGRGCWGQWCAGGIGAMCSSMAHTGYFPGSSWEGTPCGSVEVTGTLNWAHQPSHMSEQLWNIRRRCVQCRMGETRWCGGGGGDVSVLPSPRSQGGSHTPLVKFTLNLPLSLPPTHY